jgi:hypothetical protein
VGVGGEGGELVDGVEGKGREDGLKRVVRCKRKGRGGEAV